MFGIKKHDDQQAPVVATPLEPDATLGGSREAFSLDEAGTPPTDDPIPFSDKDPEERLEETLTAQANTRKIREETHTLVSEEHPEVEREDTVDKAHERGEL